MQARIHALLIYGKEKPVPELEPLLERQGIAVSRARSCAEAEAALACVEPPILILTETSLSDGTWADVEALARRQRPAVPVIVVSRFVDLPLYLEVLESGASDFIVPPFREADFAWVVAGALMDRSRIPYGLTRKTGMGLEVSQYAQDYAAPGARAAHAQTGR